jgi:spermidine synthase
MPKLIVPTQFDLPGYPPATISHEKGLRFLHLGTSWVQGAMRLRDAEVIELEYVQLMMMWLLFNAKPRQIVQLGLGSAALTKFCYAKLPTSRITAIELNPNVIAACHACFCLPPNDARLQVQQGDAQDFVNDSAQHGQIDILQVDLYDHAAHGPVLDSLDFYQACHACLSEQGMLTVNIFGARYQENLDRLQEIFDAVVWLSAENDENLVALAFKTAPQIEFATLFAYAAQIHAETGLQAKKWVLGLQEWMAGE